MKPITATDRCNARVQRLVQVKFVVLPPEHTPPTATARSRLACLRARLRDSFTRAASILEAARP
jgi:hypothetical protein